jgi:hypothetical protein
VLSLTSVTPYLGVALSAGALDTSMLSAAIIRPGVYQPAFRSPQYTVVYVAGRASVPAAVGTAARLVVQRLAETQRGPADLPLSQDSGVESTAFSYAKSYGVLELLSPYRLPPAVA